MQNNPYGLTHASAFTGVCGGFDLGAERAGIKTIWGCEIVPYAHKILKQNFPGTKLYGAIEEITEPEYADIFSAGFPCQDISIAGDGEGIDGEQSKLWGESFRVMGLFRPKYAIIENSSMLTVRGFEQVLCDLSRIGYNAEWRCLSATSFGLQCNRRRLYCIAYSPEINLQGGQQEKIFWEPRISGQYTRVSPGWRERRDIPEPRNIRSANGFPNLVDRIKGVGNSASPVITRYLFDLILRHYSLIMKK